MKPMNELLRQESGRVSVAQILGIGVLVFVGFMATKYVPLWMDKAAVQDIARSAAARMMVDFNDSAIRDEVVTRAKERGVVVGHSDVVLTRKLNPRSNLVEVRWTEQLTLPWTGKQVLKQKVVVQVDHAGKVLKNAE